jgi:hypothetical protein
MIPLSAIYLFMDDDQLTKAFWVGFYDELEVMARRDQPACVKLIYGNRQISIAEDNVIIFVLSFTGATVRIEHKILLDLKFKTLKFNNLTHTVIENFKLSDQKFSVQTVWDYVVSTWSAAVAGAKWWEESK